MSAIRNAWEALNEDCPNDVLILAWCVFSIVVMMEYILPFTFGHMMTFPMKVEITNPFLISAEALYFMDKLGMLLGLFCIISTYTKVTGWRKKK